MSTLKPIFPINPTFISKFNIYDLYDKFNLNIESTDDINNAGIYGEDILQGFLAIISNDPKIQAPAALFQFIPKYLQNVKIEFDGNHCIENLSYDQFFNLDSRFILRLDSEKYYGIKKCCSAFRKCTYKEKNTKTDFIPFNDLKEDSTICHKMDSRVLFFSNPNITYFNLEEIVNEEINKYHKYYKNTDNTIELLTSKCNFNNKSHTRFFLRYKCPISKFYEVIVPIFFEQKIIGCFMIGQLPYNKLKDIKNKSFDLLNIEKSLIDNILFTDNDKKTIHKYVKDEDLEPKIDFNDTIEALLKHTIKFEERFAKRVDLIRHEYINTKFGKIKNTFLNDIQHIRFEKDEDIPDINHLSEIIKNAFNSILHNFKNEYGFIRVFAIKNFNLINKPNKLELIAATDTPKDEFYFDLNRIKEIVSLRRNVSDQNNDIRKYESEYGIDIRKLRDALINVNGNMTYDKETDILRYFPTFSPRMSFVFWKRYTNRLMKSENGNIQKKLYTESMFDMYTYVSSSYSTLWGSLLENELERTIRIAGHQSNQITPNIIDILDTYFKDFSTIFSLNKIGLFDKKLNDLKNNFELLKYFQTRPALLFKEMDNVIKSPIDLTSSFYKIKDLFENEARLKKNNIILNFIETKRSLVNVNQATFEHIIFNLVDNAIKYSYRGTNIELSYKESTSNIMIHVKSYGKRINFRNEIYKLYFRGDEIHKVGEGIGMYIAKKIVEAHNGSIGHNSSFISSYHMAAISRINYGNIDKIAKEISKEEYRKIIDESKSIRNKNNTLNFLATDEYGIFLFQPGPITFKEIYNLPSYLNDFHITIPK